MIEKEIELMQKVWNKFLEIHDLLTELFLEARDNNPTHNYQFLKEIDILRNQYFKSERYSINRIAEKYHKKSFRFGKNIKEVNKIERE